MLHSANYQITTFTFEGKSFNMEYDLKITAGFDNIYLKGEDEEPAVFTFFTINDRVAGYTLMNGKKEYIGAIVETVTGKQFLVDTMF